jgi:hypothetical protein
MHGDRPHLSRPSIEHLVKGEGMSQPLLGIVASAVIVVVSILYLALFDFASFVGWVSFYMLALIPFQIVVVVLWNANPAFAARLSQPAKALLLLFVTAVAAAMVTPLVLYAVGDGIAPPGPIPSQYAVIVVPTTFFLAIAFGGWPFTSAIRNPIAAGLTLLAASYALTFVLFRVFFDYEFLRGAPVYLQSAPHGLADAVTVLVFYVTALAGMFLLLHFDLWPLTLSPALMKQPTLGLVWTAIAILAAKVVMVLTVSWGSLDPMYVLTRVTAPFIFGTIVVLNMLQNSLFATLRQPLKGLANAVAAALLGAALARLFGALGPALAGIPLPSGPPAFEYELWLVNALLSVTFPFLIFFAAYFNYWPFPRSSAEL